MKTNVLRSSGQTTHFYKKPTRGVASSFLYNDYLIGIGLALQKKRGQREYLASSGNVVQRWIGNKLEQVNLQYTNKSFYFAQVKGEGLWIYGYLPCSEKKMALLHDFAHVGKRVAAIKAQQINEVHKTASKTNVAGAIDLLFAKYPGTLTMLHPIKTRSWIGKDKIDWYAKRGGQHYRIETSSGGATLRQWSDNQRLLQVSSHQIQHHQILLHQTDR